MRTPTLICIMVVLGSALVCAQKNRSKETDKNSEEKNKTTARRVFDDLWTGGRYELVNSMYETNAMVHFGNESIPLSQAVADGKEWRSAFPDLMMRANQVTGNANIVDVRWSAHGTNKGRTRGLPGQGKPATIQGTSKFRFDAEGKIAEVWVSWNESDLRRQVGGK